MDHIGSTQYCANNKFRIERPPAAQNDHSGFFAGLTINDRMWTTYHRTTT